MMHWILAFVSLLYKNTLWTQCLSESWDSPAELFIPVLDSVPFPFPAFQQWIGATADGVLEQAAAGSWGGQRAVPGAAAAQAHGHYKGTTAEEFWGGFPWGHHPALPSPEFRRKGLVNLTDSLFWNWFSGIWFYIWSSVQIFCALWVWGISSVPLQKAKKGLLGYTWGQF